jgi:hypothetical protein
MNKIEDLPKGVRGSASSDFVESIRFKLSILGESVSYLCATVR